MEAVYEETGRPQTFPGLVLCVRRPAGNSMTKVRDINPTNQATAHRVGLGQQLGCPTCNATGSSDDVLDRLLSPLQLVCISCF